MKAKYLCLSLLLGGLTTPYLKADVDLWKVVCGLGPAAFAYGMGHSGNRLPVDGPLEAVNLSQEEVGYVVGASGLAYSVGKACEGQWGKDNCRFNADAGKDLGCFMASFALARAVVNSKTVRGVLSQIPGVGQHLNDDKGRNAICLGLAFLLGPVVKTQMNKTGW